MSEANYSETPSVESRLDGLELLLESATGNADDALEKLSGRSDAAAVSQKLSILISAGRIDDAATFVRELPPHPEWCDKAVSVLAQTGNRKPALQVIEWTKNLDNLPLRRRCMLRLAQGTYAYAVRARGDGEHLSPDALSEDETRDLQLVMQDLDPLLLMARANARPETQLQTVAVQLAVQVSFLLGRHRDAQELGALLERLSPVPLVFVSYCLGGICTAPHDLPDRLRSEHGDSFEAQSMAVLVEGRIQRKARDAFESARDLLGRAPDADSTRETCKLMFEFAQELDEEAMAQAQSISEQVLDANDQFLAIVSASRELRHNNPDEAARILDAIRDEDSPDWLQMFANVCIQKQDAEGAVRFLQEAAKRGFHPDIYRKTAHFAHQAHKIDVAISSLKALLAIAPDDRHALNNLCAIYIQHRRYDDAVVLLRRLIDLEPDDLNHAINLAGMLALTGAQEEAIETYHDLSTREDVPVAALLGYANLLKASSRPDDAFEALLSRRDDYWDDPIYVLALVDCAYAAQHEDVANEAFQQLNRLQLEGKADQSMMRAVSLDNVKEMIKKGAERNREMHEMLRLGHAPWLMVEQLQNTVSYWGWRIRTQPMRWRGNDPVSRARYCVYSTNWFVLRKDAQEEVWLEPAICPPKGSEIAADLTALITLHELGLLGTAADYFGRILIPSTYQPHMLHERSRLILHQRSRQTSAEEIKAAVDSGHIVVRRDENQETGPLVDEHTMEDDHSSYRLIDIVEPTHGSGAISDAEYRGILPVCQKQPFAGGDNPSLQPGWAVTVALSTLSTLYLFGVLAPILATFQVHMTQADMDELSETLTAVREMEAVKKKYDALHTLLANDSRFAFVAYSAPEGFQQESPALSDSDITIAAALLAQERKIPLLVDDRTMSALMHNEGGDPKTPAFDTATLLAGLQSAELISLDDTVAAYLALVSWRYRFVVVPPDVLVSLAASFSEYPPGRPLQDIALYVHDCMRDLGLFAGLEPTTPPVSIAGKLTLGWVQATAEFIALLWQDARFDDTTATELTRWAVSNLLPSIPRAITGKAKEGLGGGVVRGFVSHALIQCAMAEDGERAGRALSAIRAALGLENQKYTEIVIGVLDVYATN